MTQRGTRFTLAIAAAMGVGIATVLAGCGVKAPPRPPLKEPPAEPAAVPASPNAPAPPASDTTK